MQNPFIQQIFNDWQACGILLQDSLSRYAPYEARKKYSAKELEFYDSLSFRYTKCIEAAFYFFRTLEMQTPTGQSQFVRDQLLKMEKFGIIHSTDEWMQARELRNKITHTYEPQELEELFKRVIYFSSRFIKAIEAAGLFINRDSTNKS